MGSPQVSLQNTHASSSHISPMSGPLFTEDRLSTSSEQEICDQEVTTIIRENTPTRSPAHTIPSRPGSIATVDYSAQGDPDQSAHSPIMGLAHEQTSIVNTHNYLLPDGTGRRILDIPISERKPFALENGHAAYQIQLETLEPVLETSTYLLDRLIGQFHTVYDDGYRQMATTPMLLSTWHKGQLIDELEETHAPFGLPPKEAPSPARQPAASQHLPPAVIQRSHNHAQNTAENDEAVPDLNNHPPPPRTVEYLELSFSLERPVHMLKMDKRLERPEEPLQTYNARYQSYYELPHEGLTIGSNGSKVSCIHYANSLHGKLGDEMEGRFNQRLPENLQEAFERAEDFEPRILTKQRIHTRKVNEVNYIDVSSNYQEFEVNEVQHV